jgi:hypothetical protein
MCADSNTSSTDCYLHASSSDSNTDSDPDGHTYPTYTA